MNTSARNHLKGKIKKIETGAVNSVVSLELPGGTSLSAVITNESCKRLGLEEGKNAGALIKASQILIGVGTVSISAKNILTGKVESIIDGPVNCELSVKTPGGDEIVAVITEQSRKTLGIEKGLEVSCIFKATTVILTVE